MHRDTQSQSPKAQFAVRSAIFLITYLLCGYLSLHLIVPPGFVSLVWLPGGVALGVVMIWSLRYLPVIALGSLVLNIYMMQLHINTHQVLHANVWLLDICLIAAPLLQVMTAWLLIKFFMDINKPFSNTVSIILFALFAGPAASLVSASFSTVCLFFFGLLAKDTLFLHWFALWVGESIGVLIITPIMIMLYSSKHMQRKQVYLFFSLPLIIVCLSILTVFFLVNRYEFNRVHHLFYAVGHSKSKSMGKYYQEAVHQTKDFGEYVLLHPAVSGSKINRYVAGLLSHHTDIVSMGWMNHADMGDLIHQLRAQRPSSKRFIAASSFLPPMLGNRHSQHEGVIRVKANSLSSILNVFSNSLEKGKIQLIFLDCDLHAQRDIGLLVVPIVEHHKVVACVFSLVDFNHDILSLFKDKRSYKQVALAFHNLNFNHQNKILYNYQVSKPQLLHHKFEILYDKKLTVAHQQFFTIHLQSSEWFIKQNYSWLVWFMIVGGLFFCILMEILLLIVYGQKELVQAKINKQAALLAQEKKTNFQLLQSAGEGIFGVNDLGMITFANPAMCYLLGYESADLIGYNIDKLQLLIKDGAGKAAVEKSGAYLLEKESFGKRQEIKIKKKDGQWLWVDAIRSATKGEGSNSAVIMFSDVSEQKEATSKLEQVAHFDLLTGLPNRLSFLEYLEGAIHHAQRTSEKLAICFLDMDNFKHINDRLGHQVGDQVLSMIPTILAPFQRSSDYLARLSGDEFALILHNVTSTKMIVAAITRYLGAFEQSFCVGDNEVKVTFSAGIAIYPTSGQIGGELLKNADIAMYKAKDRGKNTFAMFNEAASYEIERFHKLNESFNMAIEENQFYLEYQPQVDAKTKAIYGVEALIRWKHPELGLVVPGEFILVAESSGFIKDIGRWVFKQIAEDYKRLMSICKDLKISINVSTKQLELKGFEAEVQAFIEDNGIKPESIIIEVTETALMHNFEKISGLMACLSKLGIGFSLDDFGMEYSSLNYLQHLEISCIKIDKNFVHDMCGNKVSAAIVSAIIKLAHSLHINSIAEGVETKEQLNLLRKDACDYIQGYYFSRPVDLATLMKKWSV